MSNCHGCRCDPYEIILHFPAYSKALEFLADLENWLAYKQTLNSNITPSMPTSTPKREDKRGRHTRALHAKAREYQTAHPLISYHECMRLCSQTI